MDAVSPPFPMPASGLGRMTLREYAERYSVDFDLTLSLLRQNGQSIDLDARMRDEANRMGTDPEGIIERLNSSVEP